MAFVLTVDDERHIRQLLGHIIRHAGHEVAEAGNAEEALQSMQQRAADVVFTDIQMPGHDGRWLTVELRKRYPHTAVVLATSVKDLEPSITLRFGVISYLVKPFNAEKVRQTLEMAVAWHNEAKTVGTEAIEQVRLEEWLDSLEIL
jgi:two-component system LytT family response regulator/two-component system response regulator LytT